ncbi:MAG: LacI family DNA-binding transcriptional regulator [Paludibacteraceae bacterium]
MAAITIKDIAHELHFSVSTVSRALQNHPDISEETKKIITNYAREHHYRPNQMASSLRTQKVTTIGLILPELTSYFFSTILEGVEKAANVAGYNVLIARTKEDPEHEKQCLQMLDNARVAGIIACPTKRTFDFRPYENMIQQGVPMVVVDRYSPLNCDQVISDDFGGAFQAVEYLIQTGCKRIVMLTTPFSTAAVLERQRGYKAALEHYNFTYSEQNIHYADTREEAVREASAFFAQEQRPDAVFCVNDSIADGVIYVAKMMHISIPDELSVCGFSNDIHTRLTDPMQTTVEQYGKRIGKKAVERLIFRLEEDSPKSDAEQVVIQTGLRVRETTH